MENNENSGEDYGTVQRTESPYTLEEERRAEEERREELKPILDELDRWRSESLSRAERFF